MPALRALEKALALLDDEQRSVVKRCVIACLDEATHDFLFKLHERSNFENDIRVTVDEINVEELSEAGMHHELFCEGGWQALYSKYGEAPDEA